MVAAIIASQMLTSSASPGSWRPSPPPKPPREPRRRKPLTLEQRLERRGRILMIGGSALGLAAAAGVIALCAVFASSGGFEHIGEDCMQAHHERVHYAAHDDLVPVYDPNLGMTKIENQHTDAHTEVRYVCDRWEKP